jgi:hypothetical protein
MTALTLFGVFSVSPDGRLLRLQATRHLYILGFAFACAPASVDGFL